MTIAAERIQKLLDPRFTDLPAGLRSEPASARDGLAIVGHGAASVAAQARLLAAPVMLELPTSSIAEGIEDRVTMAAVGAGRLQAMSELFCGWPQPSSSAPRRRSTCAGAPAPSVPARRRSIA